MSSDKEDRSHRAPGGLSERGKRIWREVIAYLRGLDAWRPAYRELVERYVRATLRADAARREAEKEPTVDGSKGQPVANPLIRVAREAEQDAHRYAEALLLTPAAARRLLEEPGDDSDELGF